MKRTCSTAPHALLCAGLITLVTTRSITASEPEATPTASVELVALAPAFTPGHHFTLALDLDVPKGWHTYWINPGATGMAPEFKWKLPPGVSLAALHFPVPQRYDDGVGISLGYTGIVRLLADFTTTPEVADTLEIGLNTVWMICRDICIPFTSQTGLTLTRNTHVPAPPDKSAAETAARKRLPQAGNDWKATIRRNARDDLLSIRIKPPPTVKLPAVAWQKAWLFPVDRDVIDLATPPRWQREGNHWVAQVKRGLKPVASDTPFMFILAFSALSDTGWLLQGAVDQPNDSHP